MPVKASDIVKTIDITVTKRNGDGQLHDDVLKVKYRPITKAWLDKWAKQLMKEYGLAEERLKLYGEKTALEAKLAESKNGDKAKTEAELEAVKQRIGEHEEAHPAPEYDFTTRQMADLLLDVGYVDDEEKPIPVTEDFLATVVDRELLEEIKERIEKKLIPR